MRKQRRDKMAHSEGAQVEAAGVGCVAFGGAAGGGEAQ